MFTQCPDCRKVYPLASELNPEDKTRMFCGTCGKDFNVLELLTENPEGVLVEDSPRDSSKIPPPLKPKPKKKRKSRAQVKAQPQTPPAPPPEEKNPLPEKTFVVPLLTPAEDVKLANTGEPPVSGESKMPWETESEPSLFSKLGGLLPFRRTESTEIHAEKLLELLNYREAVPESDETEPASRYLNRQVGCLAGLLLLLLQLLAYGADDFVQNASYRPYLERFCRVVGCRLTAYRNLDEFEVMQGSFTNNPDKTITFKLVISNQSEFRQKLPLLTLTLVNYEEKISARRVFTPHEYLANTAADDAIGPDEGKEVQLHIAPLQTPVGGYYFDLRY
jgi:Protein of unknown function (DUF3426)